MNIKTLAFFGIIALSMALTGCMKSSTLTISRLQDLNQDWKFTLSDPSGAEDSEFDDSQWKEVDLPFDWSTEDYANQDSIHIGPFYKDLPGGADVGYLRDGTAWYRKSFHLPKLSGEQQVILHFDGVQSMMQLWVNGQSAGDHTFGYTPFYFNITPYLEDKGSFNTLAVRVVNPGENSRWFAGAGIYRPVKISIVNEIAVDVWGASILTSEIDEKSALVDVKVDIQNHSPEGSPVECVVKITGPEGSVIELPKTEATIDGKAKYTFNISGVIENPKLWDTEKPHLYSAEIELWRAGALLDSYPLHFGIRSLSFSAEKGFLLNGKMVLLKGGCMHHDNGILGAAVYPAAEERRVRIMKENGFNAIRTSHNPPSEAFLDACDKLGMLVIDESFDAWLKPKRKNDYSAHFESSWEEDLRAMLLRDRNHPSIMMWSFGNEIQERADSLGLDISRELINTIKSVDISRPVTEAICDFWDNPGKTWDYAQNAFELLDISGYNYQWKRYESDHEEYPMRVIYGSESVPKEAWDNWELVKKHSFVIGDFVWTGMDYIGESAIGHARLVDESYEVPWGYSEWPWYISWCGDIDIIGDKKPQSFYRDVLWGESQLEMLVHSPVPEGKKEYVSWWGWPDELKSWTWPGAEGQTLDVNVYSSHPMVILKKDGEVIGQKYIREQDKYTAQFSVEYSPGILEVIGVEDGVEKEHIRLTTATETSTFKLIPDSEEVEASRDGIAYIHVEAVDSKGNHAPIDTSLLDIEISGEGELLAAGSASPFVNGSFTDDQIQLFRGKGLIIVRSTGETGMINISISHDQLGTISCSIKAK